uniref:60S ribosomal protein L32 n=1 Tax=Mustela putorius furo TaxID=9669 RepID=M3YXS4_MUSPF
MATLRPLVKPKIIRERTKKFVLHQSDTYVKMNLNWQKSRGIYSRAGRRLRDQILMPSVDYGGNKKPTPSPEDTPNVSSKNSKANVERAAQLANRVTNLNARLCSEENE